MDYELGGGRGQRTLAEAGSDLMGDYGLDFVFGMIMQFFLWLLRPILPAKTEPRNLAPVKRAPAQPKRPAPAASQFELEMNFEDYRG